jgi:hypothetical protein
VRIRSRRVLVIVATVTTLASRLRLGAARDVQLTLAMGQSGVRATRKPVFPAVESGVFADRAATR